MKVAVIVRRIQRSKEGRGARDGPVLRIWLVLRSCSFTQRSDATSWNKASICGRGLGTRLLECRHSHTTTTLFISIESLSRRDRRKKLMPRIYFTTLNNFKRIQKLIPVIDEVLFLTRVCLCLRSAEGCFRQCAPGRSWLVGGRCVPCQCQGDFEASGGKVPCVVGEHGL